MKGGLPFKSLALRVTSGFVGGYSLNPTIDRNIYLTSPPSFVMGKFSERTPNRKGTS